MVLHISIDIEISCQRQETFQYSLKRSRVRF
jgi:hypothetical protein